MTSWDNRCREGHNLLSFRRVVELAPACSRQGPESIFLFVEPFRWNVFLLSSLRVFGRDPTEVFRFFEHTDKMIGGYFDLLLVGGRFNFLAGEKKAKILIFFHV